MSASSQGSSVTSPTGVDSIVAHEAKEHERIEGVRREIMVSEKKKKEARHAECLSVEKDEKTKAEAELRSFEENDLPKIIEKGEEELVTSVRDIDALSTKTYPKVLKSLTDAVIAGGITA